jgi:hypothetical protein
MEDIGTFSDHLVYIFYGHLVYFVVIWYILLSFLIWYILLPFGIFCLSFSILCCHLVYFPRLGILYQEKSGNPDHHGTQLSDNLISGQNELF